MGLLLLFLSRFFDLHLFEELSLVIKVDKWLHKLIFLRKLLYLSRRFLFCMLLFREMSGLLVGRRCISSRGQRCVTLTHLYATYWLFLLIIIIEVLLNDWWDQFLSLVLLTLVLRLILINFCEHIRINVGINCLLRLVLHRLLYNLLRFFDGVAEQENKQGQLLQSFHTLISKSVWQGGLLPGRELKQWDFIIILFSKTH